MKEYLFDNDEVRAHMVRVCEKKLCAAFDNYCSCLGDMHKSWIREQASKANEECVHRWQDLEALKHDAKEDWDLNYDDYNEEIETIYFKK